MAGPSRSMCENVAYLLQGQSVVVFIPPGCLSVMSALSDRLLFGDLWLRALPSASQHIDGCFLSYSATDCHSGNQMFDLKDNHNKSVNSKCSSLLVIQYSQLNFICILPNHSKSCLKALCTQNRSRLETPTLGRLHQSCNCITQPVMDNQGCKADPAVQPTN